MDISWIENEFFNDIYCDEEAKKEIKTKVDNLLEDLRESIDMLGETAYLLSDDLFDLGLTSMPNEKEHDGVNDQARSAKR